MRGPDFQKQEAKQCLWDMDGQHTNKKARNRGKGRGKDKQLIRAAIAALCDGEDAERQYLYFKEIEAALNCHYYCLCEHCKEGD